jgi:non-homologous end joining protein Ku
LPKPSPKEIDILSEVVERFSSPFYPEDYHDEYTDSVMGLVERKAKGLKPSRHKRISPQATPEDKILPTLEQQLGDGPPELKPGI